MTQEELSDLIGRIYDCALDPERWNDTVGRIARVVGAPMGVIALHDVREDAGVRTFSHGIPAPVMWLYGLRYARRNPIAAACLARRQEGDVHTVPSLFPDPREWYRSALYREVIRTTGARDVIGLYALRSERRGVWLGAFRRRRDPDFGPEEVRNLQLLAPHIIRTMRFADLLGMRAIAAERLAATLDALAPGVWLVDRTGRVLHANAAAEVLLRRWGGPLRLAEGRLTAVTPADAARLADAIRKVVAGDFADDTLPGLVTQAAIPLGDGLSGEGLVATVLPLRDGAPPAAAVVFVQGPAAQPVTRLEAFGALHGLTPAETRCLGEIALGRNVPETAAVLGLAPSTARTHLNSIFEKTGTTSQAELVRLVAGFVAPLRD